MKRVVATVALGAALVLAVLGCGAGTSTFGHYRILLVGHGDGEGRIFLWRPGSPVKPLTESDYGISGGGGLLSTMSDGVWAPDGRSIAVEEDAPGGLDWPTPQMYVMRSDGTHIKLLTLDCSDCATNTYLSYGPPGNYTDGEPSWSPDGTKIVYWREFDNWNTARSSQDFAIVDVPSGDKHARRPGRLPTGDPVWGKPGIAYVSKSGIMLLNPATGRSRLLTRDFSASTLAWSPGRVLAALEARQIVLLAASGRVLGKLPLPAATGGVCAIAWSPNGKQILAATSAKGNLALWVGTVSTKHWERLPPVPTWRNYTYDCAVSWR